MKKNSIFSKIPESLQDYESIINWHLNKVNSKKSEIRAITKELEQTLLELPPEITEKVIAVIDLRKKQEHVLNEIDEYNNELASNTVDLNFVRNLTDITHRMAVSERLQAKIRDRNNIQR